MNYDIINLYIHIDKSILRILMKNGNKASKYKSNQIKNNSAVKNKIKDCIKNRDGYLLYNIVKMVIIIFSLLYILFLFLPHKAYVNYNSEDITSFNIYAQNITADYENVDYFTIGFEKDCVYLNFTYALIEGTEFRDNFTLKIKFNGAFNHITFCGKKDNKFRALVLTGPPTYIMFECNSDDNGYNFSTTNLIGHVVHFYNEVEFDCPDELGTEIYVLEGNNEYKLENSPTLIPLNENSFYVELFNYKTSINASGEDIEEKIYLKNISELNIKSSGVLNYIYNPEGKQYNLINQDLSLISNEKNLESKIQRVGSKYDISFSGNIDEAYISSFDLFPTFRGWYRDNIYLIPLTLVSVIFGAIKLREKG